jgi:hypothetical protein
MIHAANPDAGTIISQYSTYRGGRFLGAMSMSWSGGQPGAFLGGGGGSYGGYGGSPLMNSYSAPQPGQGLTSFILNYLGVR